MVNKYKYIHTYTVYAERVCNEGVLQDHWLTIQLSSEHGVNTSDKLHHNTLALYHFPSIHPNFLLPIRFSWRLQLCQQVCFHLGVAVYLREGKKVLSPKTVATQTGLPAWGVLSSNQNVLNFEKKGQSSHPPNRACLPLEKSWWGGGKAIERCSSHGFRKGKRALLMGPRKN